MIIKKLKNKKGIAQMWWVITAAVLALIMVMLILIWFKDAGGGAFDDVKIRISNLGDCDEDTVANMFDKCPCDPFVGAENENAKGCPVGQDARKCGDPGVPKCKNEEQSES